MNKIKLKKNIYKTSLIYELERIFFRPIYRLFYRKLQWHNQQAIPKNRPVILAINHQNALMDALIFVFLLKKQPFFLARADIFKKKFVAKILMQLKILPVFRIRDGAKNLKQNEETFDIVIKGLQNNKIVGIMPEGSHGDKRQLRQLKKGVFRIGFSIQEKFGSQPGAIILPVGLEYSNYQKAYQDLFVNFGQALELADYWFEYQKDPAATMNKMTKVLSEKMHEVMIDIQQDRYYEMYDVLRKVYRKPVIQQMGLNNNKLLDRFKAEKHIIKSLDVFKENNKKEFTRLNTKAKLYIRFLKKWHFRNWIVTSGSHSFFTILGGALALLILSPIFLAGFLLHLLPFQMPVWLTKGKIKDPQFVSSFRWVLGWLFYILLLPAFVILILIFLPELYMKIIISILILPLGWFSVRYLVHAKKLWAMVRYNTSIYAKNKNIARLQQLKKDIYEIMEKVV